MYKFVTSWPFDQFEFLQYFLVWELIYFWYIFLLLLVLGNSSSSLVRLPSLGLIILKLLVFLIFVWSETWSDQIRYKIHIWNLIRKIIYFFNVFWVRMHSQIICVLKMSCSLYQDCCSCSVIFWEKAKKASDLIQIRVFNFHFSFPKVRSFHIFCLKSIWLIF